MTGTTRTITRTARPRIPQGRQAVSSAFCVAGPGSAFPGSFAYRSAAATIQPTGTTSTGFVVAGKWLVLDPFSFSLEIWGVPAHKR